jgi:hypothetical protein
LAEWLTVYVFASEHAWRETHGSDAQRQQWCLAATRRTLECTPTQLENAQLAFGGWVDLFALLLLPNLLTNLMHPQGHHRTRQSQMVQAFGVPQLALRQLTTAGLIVSEGLLDVHTLQVMLQVPQAGPLVRDDRT